MACALHMYCATYGWLNVICSTSRASKHSCRMCLPCAQCLACKICFDQILPQILQQETINSTNRPGTFANSTQSCINTRRHISTISLYKKVLLQEFHMLRRGRKVEFSCVPWTAGHDMHIHLCICISVCLQYHHSRCRTWSQL